MSKQQGKKKEIKPVRAWAVWHDKSAVPTVNGICYWWQKDLKQLEVFVSKMEANKAKEEWDKNASGIFKIIPVLITPISVGKGKKK